MEKRYLELKGVECRANEDKSLSLSGYAVRFNEPSGLLWGEFVEYIERNALDGVELDNTFLLYNHNTDYVLGNTRSGTLTLSITELGLAFRADLPETNKAKEVYELVKRGDINGMSFGFTVEKDRWNMNETPIKRHIEQIGELIEVSIVPMPAYDSTEVDARTIEHLKECKTCRSEVKEILTNPMADEAQKILNEVKKDEN